MYATKPILKFTVYTRDGTFENVYAASAIEAGRIIINRTLGRARDVHAVRA